MSNINTEVANRLAAISPVVTEKVIDHLVSKEVNRRADAVITALGSIDKFTAELKKHKPDVVSYDDAGAVVSASWTKAKLEEKNKVENSIKKLNAAVEKALNENDYADLFNLTKQNQQPATDKAAQ